MERTMKVSFCVLPQTLELRLGSGADWTPLREQAMVASALSAGVLAGSLVGGDGDDGKSGAVSTDCRTSETEGMKMM